MMTTIRIEDIECPKCGNKVLVKDTTSGDIICEICGEVIQQHILDERPYWRAYDEEQKRRREHVNPIDPKVGNIRPTTLDGFKDASGRKLSPSIQKKIKRLQTMQKRISKLKTRSLENGLREIKKAVYLLKLPVYIQEEACRIYILAFRKELTKGRLQEAMVLASILAACRLHEIPISGIFLWQV